MKQKNNLKISKLIICLVLTMLLITCSKPNEKSETNWEKTDQIHPQPNAVSTLTEDQISRIRKIHGVLSEADTSSLDKWISDFEKDQDPEKEIGVWEKITAAYQCYCSQHSLNLEAKQDVLGILLLRSETDDETEVVKHEELKVLTAQQSQDVMKCYRGNAEPIEVETK